MSLKVIGAGWGRTGTMSLKAALEELGLGPCHHMAEVFRHPEQAPLWEAAADVSASGGTPDWPAIFAGYNAAVDWPVCHFYRQLAALYPAAKLILTLRDPERWFVSTQETIFRRMSAAADESDPWWRMVRKIIVDPLGGRDKLGDRAAMIAAFNRHNAEVVATIPKERLLVYEVADGWAPLCRFLGVAVPEKPFPNTNSTEEFKARQTPPRPSPPPAGR